MRAPLTTRRATPPRAHARAVAAEEEEEEERGARHRVVAMLDAAKEGASAFVAANFAGPPPRGLPPLPPIAKLSPRVIRVLGQNPSAFTLQGTNTYLVGTGKTRWLIDTGEGKRAYAPLLRRAMKAHGVEGLEGVLLTHWHGDHVGGLASVRAMFPDVAVVAHKRVRRDKGEKALGEGGNEDPRAARTYADVADGAVFRATGATIRAMRTPGHSEDHVVFVLEEEGAMFAGDCVLNGNTATFECLTEYSASLERMERELRATVDEGNGNDGDDGGDGKAGDGDDGGEITPTDGNNASVIPRGRLYPSHGEVIRDGVKKLAEYRKHRSWRENIFMDELRDGWRRDPRSGGMTAAELCDVVYSRQVSWLVLKTACAHITSQHLAKMTEEGRVVREERGLWGWVLSSPRYRPAASEMGKKAGRARADPLSAR